MKIQKSVANAVVIALTSDVTPLAYINIHSLRNLSLPVKLHICISSCLLTVLFLICCRPPLTVIMLCLKITDCSC